MNVRTHPASLPFAPADALVRLSSVAPFLAYLKERRVDVAGPLAQRGLDDEAVANPDRLVHVDLVYGVLNDLARVARDPFLGVHVGEDTRPDDWLFNRGLLKDGDLLVTTLTRMIEQIPRHGASVQHQLQITGERSTYRVVRPYRTKNAPLQSEGLGVALRLRLFDQMRDGWDPQAVEIGTSFPEAIPSGYRGTTVTRAEDHSLTVSFPTEWCHRTIAAPGRSGTMEPNDHGTLSLFSALESAAATRLREFGSDLKASIAADLGVEPQHLESTLADRGTTFAKLIRGVRLRLAMEALATEDTPISEIAERLGFTEAANFTRFFKAETDITPRAYRARRRQDGHAST